MNWFSDDFSYPQSAVTPLPAKDLSTHADMEEIAKKERQRIEQLIRNKGMKYGACPRFTVGVKGQKVLYFFFPVFDSPAL